MNRQDFNTTFLVSQTPDEVYNAILDVRGWWSQNIKGNTAQLYDEFTYQVKDIHKCTMKLIEVVPSKKVVWLVLDNYFKFTKDRTEWTGTKIEFDISEKGKTTVVRFVHRGLNPTYECYDICVEGWSNYINKSLQSLITTGKGKPNPNEETISQDITGRIVLTSLKF